MPSQKILDELRQRGFTDQEIQGSFQRTGLANKNQDPGLANFASLAGGILGGGLGTLVAPGVGTAAGGALGSALGNLIKQNKQNKGYTDLGEILVEAGFGALGGLGKGAKAAKTVDAATDAGRLAKSQKLLRGGAEALEEGTRGIKVPASIFGAAREKAINKTLTKYGLKGTAQAQYEQLAPTISKIEDAISGLSKGSKVRVNVSDIKGSFINKIQSALRSGDLTNNAARKEINGYLADLMTGVGKSKGSVLNLEELRDLKKLVNADFGRVADKIAKGVTLNSREKVVQVAWESLDDAVKNAAPEVKKLLKDQSNIYAAAQSLSRARANPPTLRVLGNSLPAAVTQAGRDIGSATLRGGANALGAVGRGLQTTGRVAGQGFKQAAGRALAAPFGVGDASQYQGQAQQQDLGSDFPDIEFDPQLQQETAQRVQSGSLNESAILEAMMLDLAETGGKNIDKIEKIAKFAGIGVGGTKTSKLSDTAIKTVSDIQTAMGDLEGLRSAISGTTGFDIPGLGTRLTLPTQSTRISQAEVDRVRQTVGKALEGGVLRKEDEEKYKRILPTINDSIDVANAKIDSIMQALHAQMMTYTGLQNERGSGVFEQQQLSPEEQLLSTGGLY